MNARVPVLARATAPDAVVAAMLVAALAVGVLAARQPFAATAIVAVAVVGLLIATDVRALPLFLVATMFVEGLAFGSLSIGRIAAALSAVVLLYYLLAGGKVGLRPNALLAVAGLLGFWMLLSTYWAGDAGLVYETFASYLIAIAYMLSFGILVRSVRQVSAIFVTFTAGSLVFGALSFLTYTRGAGTDERAQGLTADPNYFAVYLVAALPAALALAAGERRPQRRLLAYAAIAVIVPAVVSTLSRTGLVALALVVVATLLLPWRAFFRRRSQKLAYVLAIAGATLLAVTLGSAALVARVQTILDPSEERGAGRTDIWRAALHGWHEDPWFGIGAGNFQAQSLDLLQSTPGVDTTRNYVYGGRVVHNAYLEMLTELGIVGIVLFVALVALAGWYFVSSFLRARAAGDRTLERFSLALLLSLVGFAASAFFLSNEFGKLAWTLVGMALAMDAISRRVMPLPVLRHARGLRVRLALPSAVPEAAPEPAYDLDVRERLVEERERRVAEEFDAIRQERRRLARLEATLSARLEGVESRQQALAEARPEAAAAFAERLAEFEARERDLARRAGELAAREQTLELRAQELDTTVLGERERLLEERVRLVTQRELAVARMHSEARVAEEAIAAPEPELVPAGPVAPAAEPEPVAEPEPERVPEPVAAPEPEPEPEPASSEPPGAAAITLTQLERAVEARAHELPDERVEEWRYYLVFLRDYADYDGRLPESFDSLVWDVFAELLEA